MKLGTKVIKNKKTWVPNDFDGWGRGLGVGVVVKPPFPVVDLGIVDVRWPKGRCFENIKELTPYKTVKKSKQKSPKPRLYLRKLNNKNIRWDPGRTRGYIVVPI